MRLLFPLCLTSLLLLTGCNTRTSPTVPKAGTATTSAIPLRVAVYESEAFAQRIVTGWQGVSEQTVQATVVTDQPLAEVAADSDLIVMPARLLGQAVKENLVAPLPDKFLESESVKFDQMLPQLRETQTRWGHQIYGLSLGSPVSMTLVRDDVPGVEQDQPLSYEQFQGLAEAVSAEQPRAAEPLAGGAAATSFLRRAAACTITPWLFDTTSFEPVIDSQPYVRALRQMIAAAEYYPQDRLSADEIWQQIVDGRLKLAIGWPVESADIDDDASIRILPAPRCGEIYAGSWQPNDGSIPSRSLLSGSGLIVALSSTCRQSAASRNLAAWMAGEGHDSLRRISPQVSVARDDFDSDDSGRRRSAAVTQYDRLARISLSGTVAHQPLRIPRADEYLAALDAAILKALDGELSAEQALSDAKAAWQKISESADIKKQSQAWNEGRGL